MEMYILQLTVAALFPVAGAALMYMLERKTCFGNLPYGARQAIVGVFFGAMAIFSTEFGIPVEGAILNVRNAAPLTAALIFGGRAGLLAGLIGGMERWFAALWGVGIYTRLACTLGTMLAGLIGAVVRKHMMDGKRSTWFYGLAVGVVSEVLHMLLVFVTNMDDIQRAFSVVEICAVPMILANGLSVMFAILAVSQLNRRQQPQQHRTKRLAQTFQRLLLICVVLAFLATSLFTYGMQNRLAHDSADELLKLNLEDVRNSIDSASDNELLQTARVVAKRLPSEPSTEILAALANYHDVTEINVIDEDGVICGSSNPDFVGYDMDTGAQSIEFLALLQGDGEYVQRYQPLAYDASISRKYAGVSLEGGGFVQVGYDAARFQSKIARQVADAAKYRRIGQNGCIIICDEQGKIVSDRDGHEGQDINLLGYSEDRSYKEFTAYTAEIYGVSSRWMYTKTEGYWIIAVIPEEEAMFSRNVAVYILAFMEIIVFAALFAHIFVLIKKLVVENIQKINRSLEQITSGNLNVTVDVRTNEEFASLSDDINSTVETLRRYIDEAEARIDKELEFARQIQLSALPSVFPPYPDRKDFSIFASMDTAKEVGGDFYDFYMLGDNQLVFQIADVSGKGIPAAMFMMTAKTLIKSLVESGHDVDEAFTRANERLCENNEAGMFVTAWLGILNLETGMLRYANAGHNPPLIRRRDGQFEFLKSRVNLVLAGMEGIRYRRNEAVLQPGDEIFLYTDGVTEAHDAAGTLFGEQRLQESLNQSEGMTVEELCRKVKADVDAFVNGADQFDDITMLSVRISEAGQSEAVETTPDMDSVSRVSAFVEAQAEKYALPIRAMNKLMVATDEIYSNIVRYSGATQAKLYFRRMQEGVELLFTDNGMPYNPLEARKPDVTAAADEREIGGLGIFMVRNMMDSVDYTYKNGENRLKLMLKV